MNVDLAQKLEAYIEQLDRTVNAMEASDFPFSDAAFVYNEVSGQLKKLLGK